MILLIRILLKKDFRLYFPSRWSWVFEVLSIFLGLSVYWLTSKALSPNLSSDLQWFGQDYFGYVILGEIVISIPSQVVTNFIRTSKAAVAQGLIDQLLLIPSGISKYFVYSAMSQVLRDLAHITLTLVVAITVFEFQISMLTALAVPIVIALALPAFIGLGLCTMALMIRFGRGQGVLTQLNFISVLLSGAYFPLSIFPPSALNILELASPFAALLQLVRHMSMSNWEHCFVLITGLFVWNFVLVTVGYAALSYAQVAARSPRPNSYILR